MSENVSKMEELYAAVDRVEGFVERVASHVKSAGQRVNDLEAAFIKTPGGKAWKQTQGQSEDEVRAWPVAPGVHHCSWTSPLQQLFLCFGCRMRPLTSRKKTPAAIAALRPELMLSNAADSTQ